MNNLTPKQLSEAVFQAGFEKGKEVARQEIIENLEGIKAMDRRWLSIDDMITILNQQK
jgi:hypothetical protein